jgi:hypothetical protein
MNDQPTAVSIELAEVDTSRSSRLATELGEFLLSEDPSLEIEQVRTDPESQDFGAALILFLGTPAVIAVARGIQRWVERRGVSSLTFKSRGTSLTVNNLTNKSATELSRELIELMSEGERRN